MQNSLHGCLCGVFFGTMFAIRLANLIPSLLINRFTANVRRWLWSLSLYIFRYSVVRLRWNVMARVETRFRLAAKWMSPFKSAGASVQSTTDSRGVRISGSNSGYATFRGSVKSTGHPLHSTVSPSFPLPCVTVCHHISTELYPLCVKSWYSSCTLYPHTTHIKQQFIL
jgi:hypothetical protein